MNFNHVVQHARRKQLQLVWKIWQVIRSGIYLHGAQQSQIEKRLGDYLGRGYVRCVGSGHDALVLALQSLRLKPSDEVLFPVNAYPTAFALAQAGIKMIPVDVDENGQLDPKALQKKMTSRTKVLIIVHLYGLVGQLDTLLALARAHKLVVIEDCAQALGTRWKDRPVGTLGDLGCFSFYPTKNLGTLGDGGAIWTKQLGIAKRIEQLRSYGEKNRYQSQEIAGHSRLPEIQASILGCYLDDFPHEAKRRQEIFQKYQKLITEKQLSSFIRPLSTHSDSQAAPHLFVIVANTKRNQLRSYLTSKGIPTLIHYPHPVHKVPAFKGMEWKRLKFPQADNLASKILSLPFHPQLSDKEIEQVVDTIHQFYVKNPLSEKKPTFPWLILPILAWWKALTFGLAFIGNKWLPMFYKFTPTVTPYAKGLPQWVWMWANFDGSYYLLIAQNGYQELTHPFFPLFPLFIAFTHQLTQLPYLVSGLLVSHVMFGLSLIVVSKLLKKETAEFKWMFLAILLLYPTSFFYGASYNDAIFFFFACLTIYFGRKHAWLKASIMGGLATLARLNGLALAVYLACEYLLTASDQVSQTWNILDIFRNLRARLSPKIFLQSGILWTALIPLTFLGYLLYIQLTAGNWQLLFSDMSTWHQNSFVLLPQVFWRYAKIMFLHSPTMLTYWVAMIELGFVLFYLYICGWSIGKIRFSEWIFMCVSFLIPSLTGTFAGMPRYALHLFPFFFAVTLWYNSRKRWQKLLYLVCSVIMMGIIIGLFTRGYFIT